MFSFSAMIKNLSVWQARSDTVVSMNNRNLGYVYPSNQRKHYQIADNKLLTKEALKPLGFGFCETFFSYRYFYELNHLEENLKSHSSFVIKPAQGSGGNGIMVIVDKKGDYFISASGKKITHDHIRQHIGNIIFGVYANGLNDIAIIEERLIGHEHLADFNEQGLCDIRMICYHGRPIQAMMRVATKASDGKANLHQGGVGIAVDLESGKTSFAQIKREDIVEHPDTGVSLLGRQIPQWDEVVDLCLQVAEHMPLNYLGIDIAISQTGPMVLEVNARPGIEIQNVNHQGMKPILEAKL